MSGDFGTITFVLLHPGQAPDADHLRLDRVADVERPDHAVLPALRGVRQERELALVVDAEAMRAVAGQVVEADLFRLAALGDVENKKAGPGVASRVACKAPRGHHKASALDDAG